MFVDAVRHKKRCIFRPAVEFFSEADLLISERLAVRCSSVLSMRRSVPYMAIQHDKRGAVLGLAKDVEGVFDALDVIGVADAQNVPSVSQESRFDVLCKSDARFSLDR